MGRLKVWGANRNSLFSGGKYKKLLEEYGGGPGSTKDYTRLLLQESLPDYLSYACRECGHVQQLQDEELNSIVGHAFRLAYTSHLQKSAGVNTNHKFESAIPSPQHLAPPHTPTNLPPVSSVSAGSSTIPTHMPIADTKQGYQLGNSISIKSSSSSGVGSGMSCDNDRIRTPNSRGKTAASTMWYPSSLLGLHKHEPSTILGLHQHEHHQQHMLATDNINGQTELKRSKRQGDKSPQKKKMSENLVNSLETTLGFNDENVLCSNLETDDDRQPLVTTNSSTPWGSSCQQVTSQVTTQDTSQVTTTISTSTSPISTPMLGYVNDNISNAKCAKFTSETQCPDHNIECFHLSDDAKLKRISQISVTSSSSSDVMALELFTSSLESENPPPLPDRMDSLTPPDEPHLKTAAWFQAGIPREIALEILNREPIGAFMVRESTSKPGCFALSLRVPRDFTLSGIAHYLIVKNSNGYRIKGFTKEFATLSALITHHSVMPELLPCPLSLSRYKPNFNGNGDPNRTDQNDDDDPDYNTLSDFRKIMADLNV